MKSLHLSLNHRIHSLLVLISIFLQLLAPSGVLLRPGRWSGRLLKYVVYTAMTVRIRAFDHTLVGSNADSREEVMGSNPTAPKLVFPKVYAHASPFEGTSFTVHHAVSKGYQQCEQLL